MFRQSFRNYETSFIIPLFARIWDFILILPVYSFLFLIWKLIIKWGNLRSAKKIQREREMQYEIRLAEKIRDFDHRILKLIYQCISQNEEKIPRTQWLDHLISTLNLRHFFEPREQHYIVKQEVLRVIKKYHYIVFEDIYWSQKYGE